MLRRLLVLLAAVFIGVLGVPAMASAHTELEQSSPADGAEVDGVPQQVTLTFGDPVEGPTAQLGVLVGSHDPVQVNGAVNGNTVTLDTSELGDLLTDADGKWAIAYKVVSLDGHPVEGTVAFTVKGAASASSAAATSADQSAAKKSDNAATTDDKAAADENDGQMSPLLWLAIAVVIALVVFGVVKTERYRRKKAEKAAEAAREAAAQTARDAAAKKRK